MEEDLLVVHCFHTVWMWCTDGRFPWGKQESEFLLVLSSWVYLECVLHCALSCTVYCNRPCLFVCLFVGPPYYSQCTVFASPLSAFSFVYYCILLGVLYVFIVLA